MKKHELASGRLLYVLALLALTLIGHPAAFGQEVEMAILPIRGVIATSNGTADEDAGPENTVNGSGLSASNKHSASSVDMWLGVPGDDPMYIQFEFDNVYELQEMWVWNHNTDSLGMALGLGVRDMTVEYSQNGTDWTVLGDVHCPEAPGRDDYVTNTIVSLEGVSAQYVRLTILDNWGTWLPFSGLSEVRLLALQETQYPISNPIATSNTISRTREGPENTVNRSGLGANDGHSDANTDMWLVELFELDESDDDPVTIQYEFDDIYELDEIWVWNCNVSRNFGVKDITIEYSENGADWTVWGNVQFARASGERDYAPNTFIDLAGVSAQYIRFTILSTWGTAGVTGLSEVRFFTNQAPPPYALLLDDFETYGYGDTPEEPILYEVWADGWANGTGARVGHLVGPFVEQQIVNSGAQSMPLFYNNAQQPFYSEAYRYLEAELQDWHIDGADALKLHFHGSPSKNHKTETDRLYVALEDNLGQVVVAHHPAPQALLNDGWQEWTIGFEEFGNVDLSGVVRLSVGIGNPDNPQLGGNSVVYIDDIGLCVRPEPTDAEQ